MDLLDLLLHPQKANQRYSPFREGLTEGQANELRFIFNRVREGEHRARIQGSRTYASYDPAVRAAYARDGSSLPASMDKLIKQTPGAVVLPRNRSELAELLDWAYDSAVPLTPRGGGTGAWGGAIPAEGGVVVDMRAFDEVLEVDTEGQRVRVQGGITWADLDETLREQGLSVRAQPFTSPYSTVAGWVATGGGGFGSTQYGPIDTSVEEVVLMTPDGGTETLTGDDLALAVGTLGTTGLILEVVLKARPATETTPTAAAFESLSSVQEYVDRLAAANAYSVHVLGPEFVGLLQEAYSSRTLPRKAHVVVALFEEAHAEAGAGAAETAAGDLGGDWVAQDAAQWAWERRYQHESFKQFGPSLAKAHAVVPRARLAEAWRDGVDALKAPEWAVWAVAVGPDEFLLQASILSDERIPNYSLAVGNAMAFADAAMANGGRPYAAGLLESGSAKDILGKSAVKRLKAWKREHDKREIMNPGKVVPARVRGLPMVRLSAAAAPGLGTFKSLRGSFDHRRGSGPDTSNRALHASAGRIWSPRLAEMADDLYKSSTLGLTNRLGGLHRGFVYESQKPRTITRAHRFDTQLPRGIVAAGLAILEGARPGKDIAAHALTLPAVPSYEANDPNRAPVLAAIEAVREAAQKANGLEPVVRELVQTLEESGNVFGKPGDDRGDWLPGGTPTGVDTTTLLVAGDVGAYQRGDDAKAAFNVLTGAGFGFTTLGAKEVHPGTVPYRLGATFNAGQGCQAFAEAAEKHLGGRLPTALVTLSNEDADVLRRRVDDLLTDSDWADWRPSVVTIPQVLDALVSSGRLTFKGGAEPEEETAEAPADATENDAVEVEADGEEASEEAEGPAVETVEVTLVHSPFATEDDRQALENVAEVLPGVTVKAVLDEGTLIPDIAFQLTDAITAKELVQRAKPAIEGQALVGCTDLAHVFKQGKVDVVTVQDLVVTRMEVSGAGPSLEIGAGEEEEGFKEFDIPEGAHRVELVKEEAAIPVYPDQSILDAAEEFGFELPYDCRAGSCVSCCARWEGTPADQSEGQSLSEEEQKNYVLTCIAKPKGDVKIHSGEEP